MAGRLSTESTLTLINTPGAPEQADQERILSQWDNEELRRLELRSENPYHGMLHALLDLYSELDLTGKVHGIDNTRTILGVCSDIVPGYCTGPDGVDFKVAVKKLRLNVMEDRDFQKKLTKEIYIWSRLDSPRILPLEGFFFEGNNCPSLVSRWMGNGTVLEYLEIRPDADLVRLVAGIAEGVTYLHLNGIVHSDIKPDNVLISDFGEPLLCDFGVSRMVAASRSISFSNSPTGGGLRGTLRFMSKELLQATELSPKAYSTASDVWAFGMTIVSILTRKVPYHYISNDAQVITAINKGLVPTAPPDVREWPAKHQLLWRMCALCWNPIAMRRSIQSFSLELQLLDDLDSSSVNVSTYRFRYLEDDPVDRFERSARSRDPERGHRPSPESDTGAAPRRLGRVFNIIIAVVVLASVVIPVSVAFANKH